MAVNHDRTLINEGFAKTKYLEKCTSVLIDISSASKVICLLHKLRFQSKLESVENMFYKSRKYAHKVFFSNIRAHSTPLFTSGLWSKCSTPRIDNSDIFIVKVMSHIEPDFGILIKSSPDVTIFYFVDGLVFHGNC